MRLVCVRLLFACCLSVVGLSACATTSPTVPSANASTATAFAPASRFSLDGMLYVPSGNMNTSGIIGSLEAYAGRRPRLVGTIAGPTSGINVPLTATTDQSGNIFVSNGFGDSSCDTCTITEFAPGKYGDPAPIATVSKDVGQESGLVVDAADNIYAAGFIPGYKNAANAVYAFDHGRYHRSRILDHRFWGNGIALDSSGRIYLATYGNGYHRNGAVEIFAAGTRGSARPIETIAGSKTQMFVPHGVAIDAAGNVYVGQYNSRITVYAAGNTGNVAPMRTIFDPHTKLGLARTLCFDQNGNLFVGTARRIFVFAPGAAGDAKPIAVYGAPPLEYEGMGMTIYPQLAPGP